MEVQLVLFLEPAEADELLNELAGVPGFMVNKLRRQLLSMLKAEEAS